MDMFCKISKWLCIMVFDSFQDYKPKENISFIEKYFSIFRVKIWFNLQAFVNAGSDKM